MRKSSFGGGRPSISGAPLRVLNDNVPSKSRPSSASEDRCSFGGRSSFAGSKLPILNPRQSSAPSNQFSFLPKSGRPSSGIGVRGRTDIPKDPRPVSDKKYQARCLKQLLEFLMYNNYPHPISQKLLVSPSSKDFFKIFEFIYSMFVKGYKQVPKMEEEVPRVLKMLGYPFVLSKTYLFSVGSPHTWPYLLAALIWMIELLQMTDSISGYGRTKNFIFESDCDNFDGISEDKIIFEYCENTFNAFMSGQDSYEKFNEELERSLKQKYQGGNIEDIYAENARLEQELDLLQQADERQKQLQERIEMSKHDGKVIQTYIENIQQYKKVQEGELQKHRDDYEIVALDLQTEREKLARMQEIYEKQDLTPADVDRLRAEQEGLKQQVDHLERQIANIETDNWNITMEQARINEKVEIEVANYNRQAIALKLVPETAEFANGIDFRLRAGFNSDIVGSFENIVKPKLTLIKKKCTANLHQKSKEKFQLAYEIEQFLETINENKESGAQMVKDLSNKEAEIESMKQMMQSGKKIEQIDALKQDLVHLETCIKQAEVERARRIEESQATCKLLTNKKEDVKRQVAEMEENRKLFKRWISDYFSGLKEQISSFMNRLDSLNSDMDQTTARLQAESKQRHLLLSSLKDKIKGTNTF